MSINKDDMVTIGKDDVMFYRCYNGYIVLAPTVELPQEVARRCRDFWPWRVPKCGP